MDNSTCLSVAKSLDYVLPIEHVDVLLLQVLVFLIVVRSLIA